MDEPDNRSDKGVCLPLLEHTPKQGEEESVSPNTQPECNTHELTATPHQACPEDIQISNQENSTDPRKDSGMAILENGAVQAEGSCLCQSQSEHDVSTGTSQDMNNIKWPVQKGSSLGEIEVKTKNGRFVTVVDPPASYHSNSSHGTTRRRIRMQELAPSTSSIIDDTPEWKVSLQLFTSKRQEMQPDKKHSRRIRHYYKTQDELITMYEELHLDVDDAMENTDELAQIRRMASRLAKISFAANLILLVAKSVAAAMTGSLAVISSVLDSAMDLVSGLLMWWSSRAIKRRNLYEYPQGRTKLEPIAIVILSVVMSLASVQMVRESIETIIYYASNHSEGPEFTIPAIVICAATVVIKLILFLACRRIRSPSTQALAQDHRNDVLSNTVALAAGFIGYQWWNFADPIGALLISFYIIGSWFLTGWEQIKMLTGHTARPDFLKKLTWIALNHHAKVLLIDTVRAFHFGNNFLVEVDIVLPEDLTLRESHDIGETLQHKLERLPEVERAFVHLDYETTHSPWSEHKVV